MVIFALKNKNVTAMVSLDGSIPPGYPILKSYGYLSPSNFNTNFLGFLGDKGDINDYPLFDDAVLSNTYLLKLNTLNHLGFSSFNLTMSDQTNHVYSAYTNMANLTVRFMNHHFKTKNNFEEIVKNYPKTIYSDFRQKISLGSPQITNEKYIGYINEHGIDMGISVYYDTKNAFPDYRLFEYPSFRDVGFLKMMEKDYENAIKVYKVLLDAYPNKPDSYRRLGEAYMEYGNYNQARELLTKGATLDPNNKIFSTILGVLDKKEKGSN